MVACIFLGSALAAAAFGVLAAWLAPEWLEESATSLSLALGRLAGPPAGAHGGATAAAPPQLAGAVPARVAAATAAEAEGGLAPAVSLTVEEHAPESAARREVSPAAVRTAREADAWRSVCAAVTRLLDAIDPAGTRPLDAGVDMVEAAPRVVARIDRIARERGRWRGSLAADLEPRAVARLLGDDGAIPEARAMEILEALAPAARAEVMQRLSLIAPRRAARLLDLVLGERPPEAPRSASRGGREG
jgi:hypothetical protein